MFHHMQLKNNYTLNVYARLLHHYKALHNIQAEMLEELNAREQNNSWKVDLKLYQLIQKRIEKERRKLNSSKIRLNLKASSADRRAVRSGPAGHSGSGGHVEEFESICSEPDWGACRVFPQPQFYRLLVLSHFPQANIAREMKGLNVYLNKV